jgi:DNA-binding CsgD family transcriptional regulator/tetratricopeptide (TPR) repeat protein
MATAFSAVSGDTSFMRTRLTSSHFVGRAGELAELQLAAREAASGRPALVLLGGDSGVGKTRLVGELESRLRDDQETETLVLRGEGVEQGDGELPYAPLLSALRPVIRAHHPAFDALTSGSRAQLAAILPALDDGRAHEERSGPGGQLRLFEAVLELLDLLSDGAPVVLVLEDLHWADQSTRTLVSFLARSLRQERLALILTYRRDELHRRHPLRPLLGELERLERAHRVDLEPFDRDELSEVLADILGAAPDDALVTRLFDRSEGNPLYTEELLAAGLDGRGPTPQSLRDAFLVRIERLSPEAQRVARAIAVGRALAEPVLGVVTALERDHLALALREALAEQVLIAGEDERFCFRHALLREALYDDLLPGERGELHLALAAALEAGQNGRRGDDAAVIAAIASHYMAAGDQPAALRTTINAAAAAERVLAYGEAAELYERALELWPRVAESQRPDGFDLAELLSRAARAHGMHRDRSRGETLLREALRELDPERDRVRYAALLARLARTIWSLNRGPEAVQIGEEALALLGDDDPGGVRPSLLAWLTRMKFLRGRFRQAAEEGEAALAAAIEAGDSDAEAEVRNTLGMAKVAMGQVPEGLEQLHRAIEVAREHDELDSMLTAYSNLADILNMAGRTREALAMALEGMAASPRRMIRSHDWMTMTVSELAFDSGDWKMAREHLTPPPARLTGVVLMMRHLREAELSLGEGELDRAGVAIDAASPLVDASDQPQFIGVFGALCAELRRRRRDLEGSRRAVQNGLDRLELCTDDVMRIARVTAVGMRVEADWAQRGRDLRERGTVRDALARARIHLDRLAAAAEEGGPVERAHLAEARAEMARARGRNAAREWSRAVEAWEAVHRPYPAAIARWRQAECHVLAGERSAAAEVAGRALETAEQLGSSWLAREVRGLGERGRLELGGAAPAPQTSVSEPEDPFGLTPRERQVLALVAEGATNRQIGSALFMAEKTASVHVSRILAKLGVQGRTEAAAVAHRQHLA